jgi:hypothetical protein
MSPHAGRMLLIQIVPIIMAVIGKGRIKPTGCEDKAELAADCVAQAARMVDSAERAGKVVVPNSIAHYAVQALKSGRRSTTASRTDVMSSGACLDRRVEMTSLDEPVDSDGDDTQEVSLHDLLAGDGESPDMAAGRRLDWEDVMPTFDRRCRAVLRETAEGYGTGELARKHGVSAPRIVQIRREAGEGIREVWGDEAGSAVREPDWARHVRSTRTTRSSRRVRAMAGC